MSDHQSKSTEDLDLEGDVDMDEFSEWSIMNNPSSSIKAGAKSQAGTGRVQEKRSLRGAKKDNKSSLPKESSGATSKGSTKAVTTSGVQKKGKTEGASSVETTTKETTAKTNPTLSKASKVKAQNSNADLNVGDIAGILDQFGSQSVQSKPDTAKGKTPTTKSSKVSVSKVDTPAPAASVSSSNVTTSTTASVSSSNVTTSTTASVTPAVGGASVTVEGAAKLPTPAKTATLKRKLSDVPAGDVKVAKVDSSDILTAFESTTVDDDNKVVVSDSAPKAGKMQKKTEPEAVKESEDKPETVVKAEDALPEISEEDSKNIDSILAEEMVNGVKKRLIPFHGGDFYTVKFGPVEIADLAEDSVQKLIKLQSSCSFFFMRQTGKFKKKKGFGEAYFHQLNEVQQFTRRLVSLKLVEKRMEVTVSGSLQQKEHFSATFTILLNQNQNLMKLVETLDDSSKHIPNVQKESFQVEKVSSPVTVLSLRSIFPFTSFVKLPSRIESTAPELGFRGPATIHFMSKSWLEAVLQCCVDFTYNGHPLNIICDAHKEQGGKPKPVSGQAKGDTVVIDDGDSRGDKSAGQSKTDPDDDISSMTRDVCSDMLESLTKLKQLEADNPNVKKILEMQTQLAKLQEALAKPKQDGDEGNEQKAEASEKQLGRKAVSGESQEKKLSKKKKKEEMQAEKQRKEIANLERMLVEADEAERQREERVKQLREKEKKELEERKKNLRMRHMIADLKGASGITDTDDDTKVEAQRMLKAREERLKQEAEEQERKKEVEKAKEVQQEVEMQSEEKEDATSETLPALEETPDMADVSSQSFHQQKDSPVYTEEAYNKLVSTGATLPASYFVQVVFHENRQCPVTDCTAAKFFRTESSFAHHWDIFHKPNMTIIFCGKCSAYFTQMEEVRSHLSKRHEIQDTAQLQTLLDGARVKLVSNPSYRDPGVFLPPATS